MKETGSTKTEVLDCCVSTSCSETLLAKLPCLGPASPHLTSCLSSWVGLPTLLQDLFRLQLILEILKDEPPHGSLPLAQNTSIVCLQADIFPEDSPSLLLGHYWVAHIVGYMISPIFKKGH